ncbi:MAG: nucleotidyltransferase family protein [Phaeodactylibacter sp.]|nr:nucleotidyltransferase family protein [Phaeodactylibacter sp.]
MKSKEQIKNIIRQKGIQIRGYGVSKIGVFGSYSRGEQKEESDIDILIDFNPGSETFDNYMNLCDLLEEIFEDSEIDIVTYNGLSPIIGPKILNEVEYVEIGD